MSLVPDFRLSLALYREETRLRDGMASDLHRMKPTPRILGTLTFFRLGCRMMPLVRFLERWGDDDAIWLLASLMARVNERFWNGQMDGREAQVAQWWCAWHVGAPGFEEGRDGRALAFWVNLARDAMPKLRRFWFNHLLAASVYEQPAVWIVQMPFTLRQSVEMNAR